MLSRKRQVKVKRISKQKGETVVIIKTTIDPKDTLFPEKVARGKKILDNTDFSGLL
jgi:hypothetical protein